MQEPVASVIMQLATHAPSGCGAQGPQGQAATYVQQNMQRPEPPGDQGLKASLCSAYQAVLPSIRLCLPKEGVSFTKHTKALYELAGLCPGAHGQKRRRPMHNTGCSKPWFQLTAHQATAGRHLKKLCAWSFDSLM